MSGDLVLKFLRSSGLARDVDLFLDSYGAGRGGVVALMADGSDQTGAAEAIIPVFKHLRLLGLTPVVIRGLVNCGPDPSFGERLEGIVNMACRKEDLDRPWDGAEHHTDAPTCITFQPPSHSMAAWASLLADRMQELAVRKVVVLDSAGALFARDEPQSVFLADKAYTSDELRARGVDSSQLKAAALASALAAVTEFCGYSISLASPMNLLNELFTVRGAGTLFRAPAKFLRFSAVDSAAEVRLNRTIERSFSRKLTSTWNMGNLQQAILEQQERAAAVVLTSPFGRYLSKFAVVRECQGAGFGAEMWTELTRSGEPLYWRARSDNPITSWYAKVADGAIRGDSWSFFWIGLDDDILRHSALDYALAQPVDLG